MAALEVLGLGALAAALPGSIVLVAECADGLGREDFLK